MPLKAYARRFGRQGGGIDMDEFYFIRGYKDIADQIAMHEKIVENAEKEQKYYLKQLHATEPKDISAISLDGMPKGNYSPLPLNVIIENLGRIDSLLVIEHTELKRLKKAQEDMLAIINNMTNLYFKVAFKKEIERNPDGSKKTLQQIADELGYSYGYIMNISSELGKYEKDMRKMS